MSNSIGLIETRGLVSAITAIDAVLKNCNVEIDQPKYHDNGRMVILIRGDLSEVRFAINAAVDAIGKVGELFTSRLIEDPDSNTLKFFLKEKVKKTTINIVEQKQELSPPKEEKKIIAKKDVKPREKKSKEVIKPESKKPIEVNLNPEAKKDEFKEPSFSVDTIERLRREALGAKKEKQETKKDDVQQNEYSLDSLSKLNVHKLRRLARDYESFPIKGREISKANRDQLLEHFKKIL